MALFLSWMMRVEGQGADSSFLSSLPEFFVPKMTCCKANLVIHSNRNDGVLICSVNGKSGMLSSDLVAVMLN